MPVWTKSSSLVKVIGVTEMLCIWCRIPDKGIMRVESFHFLTVFKLKWDGSTAMFEWAKMIDLFFRKLFCSISEAHYVSVLLQGLN